MAASTTGTGADGDHLTQAGFNGRVATYLHTKELGKLERRSKLVDGLAVCVPILFLGAQYLPDLAKDIARVVGDVASVVLLAMVVLSLVLEWRPRLRQHQELLAKNIEMAERIRRAAARADSLPPEQSQLLLDDAARLETSDRTLLGTIEPSDRQWAYREALKEAGPKVQCPICGKSPWIFQKGKVACEGCGNARS